MSDNFPFIIERLERHDRKDFSCGSEPLDRYFRSQVSQDIRRRLTTCFIAREQEGTRIAGFYTLSACQILLSDLPDETVRRLPRYPSVPAARVGRLAVDTAYQGQGLGGALLANAAARVLSAEIAVFALVVDAKDEQAIAFYRHHGFAVLQEESNTLFMPLRLFAERSAHISHRPAHP
ncbi:GNAT family N-acetyltransferase [Candidatus Thiosymbion oneisti]|uniref:GNAT family N-acetyltransferase n=1 Tax=Candidatus Thiosymbion oneisti TaxID=589554 RepID=UPI000A87CFA5|nr:GNAT family N-acetyltransferase [Candidatus Thiosymbion oneisti]